VAIALDPRQRTQRTKGKFADAARELEHLRTVKLL
jgi:hypothetical protein